ncbi:pseudouridine synthase [uncultured Bacteroides sp.]|uniref:pseudouridine synthase n=1 Tax=uncultured Bacteroides sp. TaxID=162156 RepID=UPI002AABE651|nr:pseudouridine synthase [uncultured Bacteroides sp.]
MNTENENWRENLNEDKRDAGRDGERNFNRENRRIITRPSFNKQGNYDREGQQRRPYNRPEHSDNNGYQDSRNFNREGSSRPYRPSFNRDNRDSTDRPYRPSFNRDNRDNSDRPYRPRINRSGGNDRPERSYNREDRPWRPNNNEERKPWQGNRSNSNYGNSNSSYGRGEGYNSRPSRPRFNSDGNRGQGGFSRPIRRRTDDYDANAKYSRKKQIEYKEQFIDPNEPIRLNKYLANAGVCSRREADEFITAGVVSVNGEVVTELGTKVKRSDIVKFHEESVSIERKVYVLLNKPKDCVTTSDDPQSRLTVLDLVKGACDERIYPVGRLDRNTTGVLLLTNDGDLASKLTHPKFLKKKIYHVYADKNVTKHDMDQIAAGIELEDGEIKADAINYSDEVKRNQVGIEIHSGKNRIVRRIFESLGYKVTKLDRVYFAGLTKKGLRRGEWRYLSEQEVNFLRMGSFE